MPRTMTLLICALISVCAAGFTPGPVFRLAGLASAGASPTARVPVVVCPTTLGVDSPQTPVAATAEVPSAAAHLVMYSATSGYIQILGPKGLACHAVIAADGGGSISAYHPYGKDQSIGNGGVTAVMEPACMGCIITLACPFFAAARKAAAQDHFTCPVQPLGQVIYRLSAVAVAYYDPAGEYVPPNSGSLVPSNSRYPTNGVVAYGTYVYKGRYTNTTAAAAVCVLPGSAHAECTSVLNEFLAVEAKNLS